MNKKKEKKKFEKKKTCEKIKRKKSKIDKTISPLSAILVNMPDYKNLCNCNKK